MTNAQTGNPMIPNYGIAHAPQPAQAPAHVPSQPPVIDDFWSNLEQRIEPTEDYEGNQFQPPAQPQQGQAPQHVPEPQYAPPAQEAPLTPEQMAAIAQFQQPQVPVQQQYQAPAQDMSQLEQNAIRQLATTEYALSQEVAEKMVTEPGEVYPELAARLHVRVATLLGQTVQQMLPSIVANIVEQKMGAIRLEQEFFRQYPQLADSRFRPVVMHSIALARQVSPNATREQIMSDGATLAATKLRINLQSFPQQQQAPVARQPQQQQYRQTNGQQPPFQPMQGGGAGLPTNQQVPQNLNEFEALAMDPNW